MLKNFKEMAELVKANPVKKRIVLCCAHDEHSLDAVYEAYKEGIVEPVFVGKEEEIKQVTDLINEKGKEITLSSALLLIPNNEGYRCSEYLYAGNDLSLNKLNVSGGIALEAAKISIDNKCHYCNLGVISSNLDDSLTKFKSKYNAVILEFAGEYDLVINKTKYVFINKFKPILKKFYKIIKK